MKTRESEAVTEKTFSQADFNRFAQLSGDTNSIHVNESIAKQSRFGKTVAHGVLLCGVIRGLVDQLAPGARQLEQSVMFPAPTFAGDAMRFRVSAIADAPGNSEFEFDVTRITDGTVTCQGHCRMEQ
jgi:acyl dehydratase